MKTILLVNASPRKNGNSEAIIKADNIAIFDFSLTDEDMVQIRSLDTGKGSHDPETPGMDDMLLNAYKVHD